MMPFTLETEPEMRTVEYTPYRAVQAVCFSCGHQWPVIKRHWMDFGRTECVKCGQLTAQIDERA
jgi:hypothetical protein